MAEMQKCRQCGKPAIVEGLCVEHYFTWVQAQYMLFCMAAANLNLLSEEISAGTGGLMPPHRIVIPPPPYRGDSMTFNNINVDRSNIGAINTGIIDNLDATITIMQSRGDSQLAEAVKELTEAIIKSEDIEDDTKNEINEQLQFLVTQAMAEPKNRSMGLVKSVLTGIKILISVAPSLLVIWDKLEPLIKTALGTS